MLSSAFFRPYPNWATTDPLLGRIHAQFDHISETYLAGLDFDLGERELGYALSFDHDLDMFAASLGLVKTSIEAAMKEEGKLGTLLIPTSHLGANWCTRCGVGYGRLRPRSNLIRSPEEGFRPVQKRKEPIEVRYQPVLGFWNLTTFS